MAPEDKCHDASKWPPLMLELKENVFWLFSSEKKLTNYPLTLQPKKKKNISHDAFGTKFGRVHMQKQDLSKLQTRKLRGLKKRRGEVVAEEEQRPEPKVAKVESWRRLLHRDDSSTTESL